MVKTPRILFVDDDEDDRELFQIALKDLDFETDLVSLGSGAEALSYLLHTPVKPDVIFLDLNMPQMDGKECLMELKNNKYSCSIPVVIFSTTAEESDIVATRQLGAIDFITKPAKITELTKQLEIFFAKQFNLVKHKI